MKSNLSALARSGLFVLGALAGASLPATAGPISVPSFNIAPTAAQNQAIGSESMQGALQDAVLMQPLSGASEATVLLVRGGGGGGGGGHGGGGGFHGGGGGGGMFIPGGGGGGGWHGGGGGWHGGGGGWHGGAWHGNGWRGNGWRGNGFNGGWGGDGGWDDDNGWYDDAWLGGALLGWGLGTALPFLPGNDYYGPYAPSYVAPVYVGPSYAQVQMSEPHVHWCYSRYRSYRAYDNTFQPNNGPRRQCWSPYG